MPTQEFIIGRYGTQPFKITAEGVSAEHAKITIDESGSWVLEDLKGTRGNGTFIRNEDGKFLRIVKCKITEDTVIRLADSGHYSFTFMAHRVLTTKPNDFTYEFDRVCELADSLTEKETKLEETIRKHTMIGIVAPFIALLVTCLPLPIFEQNALSARLLITLSSSLVNILFFGDRSKPKDLRKQKVSLIVCPNCGRPLSEFDIQNRKCSICQAK